MVQYFGGPAHNVEVIETMEEWPQKIQGDLGWAYVAISATISDRSFSEAVTVVVSDENDCQVIRSVEWGRP
jgi:hypothetical protein